MSKVYGIRFYANAVPEALERALEGLDGFDQACIAAQFEQRLVEVQIGVKHHEYVVVVDLGAVLLLDFFEFGKARLGDRKGQNRGPPQPSPLPARGSLGGEKGRGLLPVRLQHHQ
jgi:hypothetical protein